MNFHSAEVKNGGTVNTTAPDLDIPDFDSVYKSVMTGEKLPEVGSYNAVVDAWLAAGHPPDQVYALANKLGIKQPNLKFTNTDLRETAIREARDPQKD